MKNGRKPLYADDAKIELKVKVNPGRRGTTSHDSFEIAKRSDTFGAYREAGGKPKYLYWLKGRDKLDIVA
jgi:hypothetical protein